MVRTIVVLLAATLATGDRQPARASPLSLQGFPPNVRSAGVVVVDAGVDAQAAVPDMSWQSSSHKEES